MSSQGPHIRTAEEVFLQNLAAALEPTAQTPELPLRDFIRQAWHLIEPKQFLDNWHIDAICDACQAVSEGHIKNLLVNCPPRFTKSLILAVFWPAWEWHFNAAARWLFTSCKESLALRDSRRCRLVIESGWYQRRWGDRYQLRGDQNEKRMFENTANGWRIAVALSSGTGMGGDRIVCDDPHEIQDRHSSSRIKKAVDAWNETFSSRMDTEKTAKVVAGHRIHPNDLSGEILKQGGYVHLCLPMEHDPKRTCVVPAINFRDPRQKAGELAWPARFGKEKIAEDTRRWGKAGHAAMNNQAPALTTGNEIQRCWWRYWHHRNTRMPPMLVEVAPNGDGPRTVEVISIELPTGFDEIIQSWDLAFKDTKDSSWVVGQAWGRVERRAMLLDQVRGRWCFTETIKHVRLFSAKWPEARLKLIEDKANGPAVINTLRNEIPGIVAINPKGEKVARARACGPFIQSGNVWVPHEAIAAWVSGFLDEWGAIPAPGFWDQIDTGSQALDHLLDISSERAGTW